VALDSRIELLKHESRFFPVLLVQPCKCVQRMSELQKHALEDSGDSGDPSGDGPEDATRFVLVGGSFRGASGGRCDASSYIALCDKLSLVFEWSTIRIFLAESTSLAIYQGVPSLPNYWLMQLQEIDTALGPIISQSTCSRKSMSLRAFFKRGSAGLTRGHSVPSSPQKV
jgi:hypothetical protein